MVEKKPKLKKWFHIVNQQIQVLDQIHLYSRNINKSDFKDQLITDLEIKEGEVFDISSGKKSLFRIPYNDVYYNIFIETPDAGGANRRETASQTGQKVSIPFKNVPFRRIIENYERILVIDIYYPLKQNHLITI